MKSEIFDQYEKLYWISGNDITVSSSYRWEDESLIPPYLLDWFPGHCPSARRKLKLNS